MVTSPSLQQLAQQVIDHLVSRALDGEFIPGVSWVVDTHTLGGAQLVRFFVDGDLDATVATLDDGPEVPEEMQLRIRGEISLELPSETVSALRRAFGIGPEQDRACELVAGYREGLKLTLRTVDELEARAGTLADRAAADLVRDLSAAGHAPDQSAAVAGIFGQQFAALSRRMDVRRGRLRALGDRLGEGGDPGLLEEILSEEYGVSSEAQADIAAFEDVVQRALREAASRF